MLKKGEVKMIHKMIKEGLSKSAIARKLDISRDTVSKYAKLPEGHIPVIKRAPTGTTVDAYLPHIATMLIKAHELGVHIPSTGSMKRSGSLDTYENRHYQAQCLRTWQAQVQ